MDNTKRDLKEVLEAIAGSDGVKTVIARRLGVTRQTVDSYLIRWVTAQEAYAQEEEAVTDMAQSVISGNIKAAINLQSQAAKAADWDRAIVESSDAKWWLSRKGQNRGFADKQEITGAGGGKIAYDVRLVDDSG